MLKAVRTLMSAIWVAAIATVSAASALADEWAPLAEVGPWPAATGLIGYNGRLWFANAVRYPDHNSADVYSLDPATGAVRYERHLFSQDVGHPVVAGGLLYWPFEDARVSLGWGHFALTNGAEWRMGVVPTAQIFHVFALAEREGELIAATSAWRAGLHVSTDLGRSWRQIYDRPTPERRVSRIIELMPLNGALYGASVDRLADGAHHALVRFDGAEPVVQDGWPRDARVSGLAAHGDWLYGIVAQPGGGAIWRTDGRRSEKVAVPLGGLDLRDIASAPDGLWATGIHGRNGALFFSADGMTWTLSHELIGGHPIDVAVLDDRVFVGGRGNNGRGIVWGSPPSTAVSEPHDFTPMPPPTPTDVDWHALGARLDALLVDSASYERRDTELRDVLFQVARGKTAAGVFRGPPGDADPGSGGVAFRWRAQRFDRQARPLHADVGDDPVRVRHGAGRRLRRRLDRRRPPLAKVHRTGDRGDAGGKLDRAARSRHDRGLARPAATARRPAVAEGRCGRRAERGDRPTVRL